MIDYQLGRRNISPEQQSYLRGVQYEREKVKEKFKGNKTVSSGQNDHHQKTAGKLAQQHKVAPETIRRDAKYARAVNAIEKLLVAMPKVRSLFLANPDTLQSQLKCAAALPNRQVRK